MAYFENVGSPTRRTRTVSHVKKREYGTGRSGVQRTKEGAGDGGGGGEGDFR